MAAADPIEMLQAQIEQINRRMGGIEKAIGEINNRFMANHFCPAPGKCLEIDKKVTYIEAIIEKHAASIDKFNRWLFGLSLAWGLLTTLGGVFLVLFGPLVRQHLGLP